MDCPRSPGTQSDPPLPRWVRLLAQARQGSNQALGLLLEDYRDYLLLLAQGEVDPRLRAKAGASDLVQDSLLEGQRDFAQFQGVSPEELQAWLRRILLNNVANLRRSYFQVGKRDVRRELADPYSGPPLLLQVPGDSTSPSSRAARDEESRALHEALQRLPGDYRRAIQWHTYEGLPWEEIGARLGRTADAARMLWARAIIALKNELKGLG